MPPPPNAIVDNLESNLVPVASSSVSVTVSGVTNAPTITATADYVRYSVLGGDVHLTQDGSTPSATAGFLLYAGSSATTRRATFLATKFFPVTGTPVIYAEGFTTP